MKIHPHQITRKKLCRSIMLACAASVSLLALAPCAQAQLPYTNNLRIWLKADAGVTTNGSGQVTSWLDQSANGNNTWEQVWGVESANPPKPQNEVGHPSRDGAGDFHLYPVVPHTAETMAYIRNLGRDTKPVFLSEYGIGSLFDVISEWRHFEQVGARPDLEDASSVRGQ